IFLPFCLIQFVSNRHIAFLNNQCSSSWKALYPTLRPVVQFLSFQAWLSLQTLENTYVVTPLIAQYALLWYPIPSNINERVFSVLFLFDLGIPVFEHRHET